MVSFWYFLIIHQDSRNGEMWSREGKSRERKEEGWGERKEGRERSYRKTGWRERDGSTGAVKERKGRARVIVFHPVSSVQFNPLTDWVVGGGGMRNDSAEFLLQSFLQEAFVSNSGMAGMSTLSCCPSSISSADHDVAHSPRCPEE